MHTFEGKSCRIHFNGDMSGQLIIFDKTTEKEIIINSKDILDFVADYVRNKKMANLEKMETERILIGTENNTEEKGGVSSLYKD